MNSKDPWVFAYKAPYKQQGSKTQFAIPAVVLTFCLYWSYNRNRSGSCKYAGCAWSSCKKTVYLNIYIYVYTIYTYIKLPSLSTCQFQETKHIPCHNPQCTSVYPVPIQPILQQQHLHDHSPSKRRCQIHTTHTNVEFSPKGYTSISNLLPSLKPRKPKSSTYLYKPCQIFLSPPKKNTSKVPHSQPLHQPSVQRFNL